MIPLELIEKTNVLIAFELLVLIICFMLYFPRIYDINENIFFKSLVITIGLCITLIVLTLIYQKVQFRKFIYFDNMAKMVLITGQTNHINTNIQNHINIYLDHYNFINNLTNNKLNVEIYIK